jgi:hypothetical protein
MSRMMRLRFHFDLKAERLNDGSVRIYAPDRRGESRVFTSACEQAECCDGCFEYAAFEAFNFAVGEEMAKSGVVGDCDLRCVFRLNGVPFNPISEWVS